MIKRYLDLFYQFLILLQGKNTALRGRGEAVSQNGGLKRLCDG
jgi:hypothetical protein